MSGLGAHQMKRRQTAEDIGQASHGMGQRWLAGYVDMSTGWVHHKVRTLLDSDWSRCGQLGQFQVQQGTASSTRRKWMAGTWQAPEARPGCAHALIRS